MWRVAVVVEADRAGADRALSRAWNRFDHAADIGRRRREVAEAAAARFDKLRRAVEAERVSTDPARALQARMVQALERRGEELDDVHVSGRDGFAAIERDLDRALDRWRLAPRRPDRDAVALTAAHEATERLARFADEPTSVLVVGVAGTDLLVVDVDANRVSARTVTRPDEGVRVDRVGDLVLLHGDGRVRALRPGALADPPVWERPADVVAADSDDHVWVQHGRVLRRLDAAGRDVIPPITLPRDTVLVLARDGRAALFGAWAGVAADGAVVASSTPRRASDLAHPPPLALRPPVAGWVVSLVNGRAYLSRHDDGRRRLPAVLRAPLPRLDDVVLVPRPDQAAGAPDGTRG